MCVLISSIGKISNYRIKDLGINFHLNQNPIDVFFLKNNYYLGLMIKNTIIRSEHHRLKLYKKFIKKKKKKTLIK